MKIVPVTDDFMERPLRIQLSDGDDANSVLIPSENYPTFKKGKSLFFKRSKIIH